MNICPTLTFLFVSFWTASLGQLTYCLILVISLSNFLTQLMPGHAHLSFPGNVAMRGHVLLLHVHSLSTLHLFPLMLTRIQAAGLVLESCPHLKHLKVELVGYYYCNIITMLKYKILSLKKSLLSYRHHITIKWYTNFNSLLSFSLSLKFSFTYLVRSQFEPLIRLSIC